MSNVISFVDFKLTKEHNKKIEQVDDVLKTLSICQKLLSHHKDYLIINNIMQFIDINANKLIKIKEVETLHYENIVTKTDMEDHDDD